MTNKEIIINLKTRISDFLKEPIDNQLQSFDFGSGTISFGELRNKIDDFRNILSKIDLDGIDFLPDFVFLDLNSKLKDIFGQIAEYRNLQKDSNKPDRDQKKKALTFFEELPSISNQEHYYIALRNAIWNIICQSNLLAIQNKYSNLDYGEKITSIKEKEDEAKKIIDNLKTTLTTAQEDLAKGGVHKHAKIFDDDAKEHKENASKWKIASFGLIALTILFSSYMFICVVSNLTPNKLLEPAIYSAIIISFLSYLIVMCLKNYYAEKHNETVNRHKANCLSTFDTFIESADDERKQVLLLQISQVIFSHQRSGYLGKETEQNSPNPIIEIVKNLPSNSKHT